MRDCPCPGYHMRISLGLGPRDGEVPRVPHANGGHARAYRAGLQACPTFKTSCVIGLFNTATRNPVPTACMPPDGHGARQTWGGSWPKGTVPADFFPSHWRQSEKLVPVHKNKKTRKLLRETSREYREFLKVKRHNGYIREITRI